MKNNLKNCLLAVILLYCVPTFAIDDVFSKNSLAQVEAQAAREGKLYLVDFYANWCLPCKWMDETTFSDPTVGAYLKENYIATKINIDNFDGYSIKEQYNVSVLPTLIIFNSYGEVVARYEESMSTSKMLTALEQVNIPSNRIKRQVEEPVMEVPAYEISTTSSEDYMTDEAPEEVVVVETIEAYIPEEIIEEEELVVKTEANPVILADEVGLFNFDVSRQVSSGYAVQVGVYGKYGNVLKQSIYFKEQFGTEILVHMDYIDDKEVYRLMLGTYQNFEEAQSMVNLLSDYDHSSMVKDLSKF